MLLKIKELKLNNELTVNGYTLNNHSIAILEFITSYSTNYNDNKYNEEIKEAISNSTYSPIKEYSKEPSFVHKRDVKKVILIEMKKLIKHNIIQLVSSSINVEYGEMCYVVNPEFSQIIFETDFSKIKPAFIKKFNQENIEKIIKLGKMFETKKKFDTRNIKREFQNYQSFVKDFLIPNNFIKTVDFRDTIIDFRNIYRSDREINRDLYKSQFNDYIMVNQEFFDYLEENNIYNAFYIKVDKKEIEKFIEENNESLQIFDKFKFEYIFQKNIHNEIKIFIKLDIITHHDFIKFRKENPDCINKNINYTFNKEK